MNYLLSLKIGAAANQDEGEVLTRNRRLLFVEEDSELLTSQQSPIMVQ